jgi:hypothetical protein
MLRSANAMRRSLSEFLHWWRERTLLSHALPHSPQPTSRGARLILALLPHRASFMQRMDEPHEERFILISGKLWRPYEKAASIREGGLFQFLADAPRPVGLHTAQGCKGRRARLPHLGTTLERFKRPGSPLTARSPG